MCGDEVRLLPGLVLLAREGEDAALWGVGLESFDVVEDALGHEELGAVWKLDDVGGGEQEGGVVRGVEADGGVGDVVGYDGVDAFADELGTRISE